MSIKRTLLLSIAVMIVVAVVMAVILFLPDMASVSDQEKRREMTIIIRMMDEQDRRFRANIIEPFEEEHNCKINVVVFDKITDVDIMLSNEAESGRYETGLVKTGAPVLGILKEYMIPLDEAAGKERVEVDMNDYTDKAVEMGTFDGKAYYIPRKLEVRTMIFSKSKVADAVAGWTDHRDEIESILKAENGYGLPAGYTLESDPNQWDTFDLFVVSYYWANTPYFGSEMPRMAHRAKDYEGTTTFLVDRIYAMGGTEDDILAMNTDPVINAFEWEALFKNNGLYNPSMWKEQWSGGGIWKAIQNGQVFLCFMHQTDAFFIHGRSTPIMPGFMKDPDDMGIALMPKSLSLELDADGNPVLEGSRRASLSGWWWGIPKTSPDPELSYELARWITNYENHLAECQSFGMMPIRKNVVEKLEVFPYPWMGEVFEVGNKQLPGTEPKPRIPQWTEISANYRNAWYDIVLGDNYHKEGKSGVDREHIAEVLEGYAEKNREILL